MSEAGAASCKAIFNPDVTDGEGSARRRRQSRLVKIIGTRLCLVSLDRYYRLFEPL